MDRLERRPLAAEDDRSRWPARQRPGPRNPSAEYAEQLPYYESGPALDRLSTITGEKLSWHSLVNPASADDLLITGYCFGYPVGSTAACILGTHG